MQGTILHYDSLTGCGLLRVDAHRRDDHPILFRQNQLIDARSVKAGQRITVSGSGAGLTIVTRSGETRSGETRSGETRSGETRSGETRSGETKPSDAIPDQYEELLDAEPVTYLDAKPVSPHSQPMYDQPVYNAGSGPVAPASGGLYNWPGTLVAAAAFGLLLAAGQGYKPESRVEKNVPLINSIWGMVAAALLVMTTYWQAVGMSRGRVRSAVWGVAICSIMAYLLQGCSGFVADGAAQWYIYALIVLFLIVYILPYRVRF